MTGNYKDKKPLVSVIMNCYNGEKYLKEAMDSVYSQTFQDWDIIFWDNCSTDNSSIIAKSYDERVQYHLATVNTSLGEARNLALSKAKGKYIAFLDCDDIWLGDKIEKQVNQLEANENFVLNYCGVEEIGPDGEHIRSYISHYKSGNIFQDLLKDFNIHIIASVFRASLLKESGLNFDKEMTASEEYCLIMQLSARYPIGVIEEPLAKYRVLGNSLTNKRKDRHGFERRYTLNKINESFSLNAFTKSRAFRSAFARSFYYDALWHMSEKRRLLAIKSILKTGFIDIRYFFIFIFLFMPFFIWNKIYFILTRRAS
jgi:glycosyltransferase involved in cell wall biosynthesis